MKFKLIALSFIISTIFCSCKPSDHEVALSFIEQSKEMISNKDEQSALIMLDSIHVKFPKDIAVRRMADTLKWEIEYSQAIRTLPVIDSMLIVLNDSLPKLTKPFQYIKNGDYQDMGSFEHRQLRTEINTNRCYLKPSTDEQGVFSLTSYYIGSKSEHTQMEVTIDSVTIATLPASESFIRRFVDVDLYREIIIFDKETLNGVAEFIANNSEHRIKIKLTGNNQPYIYYLNKTEKEIMTQTYALSVALSDLSRLTDQQLRTSQKIELLKKRLNL